MSQNHPNWVSPWHSPSLIPSQCFSLSRKRPFDQEKREGSGREEARKTSFPLLPFSLYLLSVLSPPVPCLFSSFPVSPLPSPSFPPLSSSLLSAPYHSVFVPCSSRSPPQTELILAWHHRGYSGRWLISWRNSGCPHGTIVQVNQLLGVPRLEEALEISADAQQYGRASESSYGTDTKWECMPEAWKHLADSTEGCALVRQDMGRLYPWCANISVDH